MALLRLRLLIPILALCSISLADRANSEPSKSTFVLEFPLKCGDPDCNFQYDKGHETIGSINSMLDHSMTQGDNGFWQYGSKKKGNADGVIIATDGTRFDGKGLTNDPTCVSGAFVEMEGQVLDFGKLMNGSGCGAGFMSYDEHPGYDFRAASKTPVFASASGKIVDLDGQRCVINNMGGSCDSWGFVGIDHGNGYISQYGHLDRIDVTKGQSVTAGQQIGLSGRKSPSGVQLGAHLHFELLYKSGTDYLVVDPYGWWGALDDPLYSARRKAPQFLWKRSANLEPATQLADQVIFLSRIPSVQRTKAAARIRNRPSATGTTIINTLPSGTVVTGLWVQGEDPSTRWLRTEDKGYIWDGNLIDALIRLGPDLPSFKTKTKHRTPIFKYELGAALLVYTYPAKNEFHIWRVEKNPHDEEFICRVSVWGQREWWTNCSSLEAPLGGWENFVTEGNPDDLISPIEDTNFPRGYMGAYLNYLKILPIDRYAHPWVVLEDAVVSSPISVRVNGKVVMHISGCKPHDCASNRTDIFLDQNRDTVKAIITLNDRQRLIGGAGAAENRCLRNLQESGWNPESC